MQVAKLLGCSPLVTSSTFTCGSIRSVVTQTLRRKRKPIWLPTAKTKVFRVPKRPSITEDEANEMQRLFNNYRTHLRSTLAYFKTIYKQNEIQLDPAVIEKAEQEDFEKCSQINEEWNKQIAAEREARLAKQMEERKKKIAKNIEKKLVEEKEKMEKIESQVKRLKSIRPTFITRENIDQAIEDALDNVVNYNKAIDSDGNWYTEPTGIPPPKIPILEKPKAMEAKQ